MIMFQNTSNKPLYIFVPVEYPELAEGEEIKPYQPGLICVEWLTPELVEPSQHN
jgi:hypothetical protein